MDQSDTYPKKVKFYAMCIDRGNFDLTILRSYGIVDEFEEKGIEYFELEYDDCGVPYTTFEKARFVAVSDEEVEAL